MYLETIRTEGLFHLSYILVSGDEAAIVDPRRDIQIYLQRLRELGIRPSLVLETHRNEDIVSGGRQLEEMGLRVYHGGNRSYGERVDDGESIEIGDLRITALTTPGHTPDSLSFLVAGERPLMLFTGDLLLPGDTGRVDLVGDAERNAEVMFESLRKLRDLPDSLIVYPSHTSGSPCGASIDEREVTTLGIEREVNEWLSMDRDSFIERKLGMSLPLPPSFERIRSLNERGAGPPKPPTGVGPDDVEDAVDLRSPEAFSAAHIPKSVNVREELFPKYSPWFVEEGMVLVGEGEMPQWVAIHLSRIGLDALYLESGFPSWVLEGREVSTLPSVHPREVPGGATFLDVRSEEEWREERIPGSLNVPLTVLRDRADEIPDGDVVVYCSKGNAASIAASLLQRMGKERIYRLLGGLTGWKAAGGSTIS